MKYKLMILLSMVALIIFSGCNNINYPSKQNIKAYVYAAEDVSDIDENIKTAATEPSKLGTAEFLNTYNDFIENLKVIDITKLYISAAPSFKQGNFELTENEINDFLEKLTKLEIELLPESELMNPRTGGGWYCYIETNSNAYSIFYNGLWFVVTPEDSSYACILMCADDLEISKNIYELMEAHLED